MTYYLPRFRNQIGDPTTTRDAFLCTMSSGAMCLDYHTRGRISVWGGTLERHQNDHSGGTDLSDLGVAWRWYGQELMWGMTSGWAGLKAALSQGRSIVLQGDYDRFTGSNSCQLSYRGPHAIALFPSDTAWAIVGDPLCNTFKTIAEPVVRAYAEKLNPRVQWAMSRAQPQLEPQPEEVDVKLTVVKGEDWTPAGGIRRPYRATPNRAAAVAGYVEPTKIVRTIAEARTVDGNNWRLTEINATPAWLLRADFEPVVQNGSPSVDQKLTDYINRA